MVLAMTDLFEMLNTLTHRKTRGDGAPINSETTARKGNGSPFESETTARKWLKSLPDETDYDTHHALVEGLERFNAENVGANAERLKVLMAIEHGADHALEVITHQRSALLALLQRRRRDARGMARSLSEELVADALVVRAEADLRWLDRCEARIVKQGKGKERA